MKKLVTLVSSAAMAVSMFAVPVSQVSAATTTQQPVKVTQTSNQPSKAEANKVAVAMQGSLIVVKDAKGLPQIKIIDTDYLATSLKEAKTGLSINEVKNVVNKINNFIKAHPSEFKNIDDNPLLRKKHKGTCAKALQFIGYVHSGMYAAAAALLGISGPAAVIVPLVIGLLYQAGSLLC
ncbi:hypothetical protein PT281_06045 [Lactobacillus sp. ESL0701]|uniref:hypothetical protein n=1 Tax=Lactobacillus sp. ESL0701 TaxID=2983217 RepID=UPI0023F9F9A2|nr:hypothetical protein [Lactobacillus sp. ESL0701]MDF7672830.1 hypothetical protein [Lactobacillus sp. ESL0701]